MNKNKHRLYSPARIGHLDVANRIVMGPMGLGYTKDGTPNQRVMEFFRQRAKGQPGIIIVGGTQIDPYHMDQTTGLRCYSEEFIPGLREFADMVHRESNGKTRLFLQFLHHGRYAKKKNTGVQAIGPSAVPSPYTGMEMPREISVDEIHELEKMYANAAYIAKEAGIDGVEICTNSGYLFGQFFSPITNLRKDEYGGSFEGRTRFFFETLKAIRDKVGYEFVVTTRIGGSDLIPGGNTLDDACQLAEAIDRSGYVDAINVTGGWHESSVPQVTMEIPWGTFSYLGRTIKKHVTLPVMMSNRLGIDAAEELVELGELDFAVFSRAFLADPQFARKASEGRKDDIRYCVGCNQKCLDLLLTGKGSVSCLTNPSCGREYELVENGIMPEQRLSTSPERILVIGAGPAGMEFARVCAARGHQVTVWEKTNHVGGQVNYAAAPPRRHDFMIFMHFLECACKKLGVVFEFDHEGSSEEILKVYNEKAFDRVVLATGGQPIVPSLPIEDGADVVNAIDYLAGKVDTGKNVVIIGGGAVGVETSLKLAEEGTLGAEALRTLMIFNADSPERLKELLRTGSKHVSIVEMQKSLGRDIGPGCRFSMMARLRQLGVDQYKLTTAQEIRKNEVVLKNEAGETFTVPSDTAVIAIGAKPLDDLEKALTGKIDKLHAIGDCVKTAKIMDAVEAAYFLAVKL